MVALLFGLHPLHVESVAWAAERKDTLSTLFWKLSLLAYVHYGELAKAESPKAKTFYALTLLAFACGLMSKPMIVTLPCIMLLLDWWPLGRMQNVECRVQNAAHGSTQHGIRNGQHPTPNIQHPTSNAGHAQPLLKRQAPSARRPARILWPLLSEKLPFLVLGLLVSALTVYNLVTVLPVIGLLQVGHQSHADGYTYVPFDRCLRPPGLGRA